jgi:ElaB/YqjD/DUF883 family membrane-anchored ribosome-binding protein
MKAHESSTVDGMAEAIGERAKGYVDAGVDAVNAVSGKARRLSQNADGYVRENPWVAIGVAAGVGVVVGLLLGRRGRS